jgi:hypothetical protein
MDTKRYYMSWTCTYILRKNIFASFLQSWIRVLSTSDLDADIFFVVMICIYRDLVTLKRVLCRIPFVGVPLRITDVKRVGIRVRWGAGIVFNNKVIAIGVGI